MSKCKRQRPAGKACAGVSRDPESLTRHRTNAPVPKTGLDVPYEGEKPFASGITSLNVTSITCGNVTCVNVSYVNMTYINVTRVIVAGVTCVNVMC